MSSTSIWSFVISSFLLIDCLCLHLLSSKKMSFYIFTSVILKELDNWDEWVLIIETMIRRNDVQKYVNLIRFTVESTESVKSSILTFFTIKLDAIKSDDLSIDQQRDLAILRENHKKTLRTYREKIETLKNLNLFILTSVNQFNLLYLRNQITIFQKLLVLKKRLALTNRIRELKVIRKYKDLQQTSKQNLTSKRDQLNQWLLEWKRIYAKTARLNLSNVQRNRYVYDFLNSLRTMNVTFVIDRETILNHEVQQEKNSSSIKNLLKKFRNHLRTIRALISLDDDQRILASKWESDSNESIVDQENLDQTSEISLCICGTNHRFSECLYIRRSIRLSEWISNSAIQETMNHRIFEIIDKLKVILNSIRSEDAKRMIEIDQSKTTNAKSEAEKFQIVYSSFAA